MVLLMYECVLTFNCSMSNNVHKNLCKFLIKEKYSENMMCQLFFKNMNNSCRFYSVPIGMFSYFVCFIFYQYW